MCSRFEIITHGKLIRVAPVAELIQAPGEFEVRVDSPGELAAALRLQPWAREARAEDGVVVTTAPDGRGRELIKFLVQNGHEPDYVSRRQHDLEDVFLSLTGPEEKG